MSKENGIFLEQLRLISKIHENVKAEQLSPVALEAHQKAFVTTLGSSLPLSKVSSIILERLAIASRVDPAVTEEIQEYAFEKYCKNNGGELLRAEEISSSIATLNSAMPEVAGLKVRSIINKDNTEAWYLGPLLSHLLSDKELFILNLIACGFTLKEIVVRVNSPLRTLKERLVRTYKRLGVESLGASLLLYDDGLLDEKVFLERIDLNSFRSLSNRQRDVLEALTQGQGRTNKQIAECLKISVSTVTKHFANIYDVFRGTGLMRRVGVGMGYWLYKKASTEDAIPLKQDKDKGLTLTKRQLDILYLASLGLSYRQIADKLCLELSTIKEHFSTAYKVLGVKSQLEAVIALIKQGQINPADLVGDFDLSFFENLSAKQTHFIESIVEEPGTVKAIANHLNYTPRTVKKEITEIACILGMPQLTLLRPRIAVLFLAYQQQKKKDLINSEVKVSASQE